MKNEYIFIVNAVQDYIVAGGEAADAGSQIVTAPTDMGMLSQQPKSVSDCIDDSVRTFDTPGFDGMAT